jgi:hypothetical protein
VIEPSSEKRIKKMAKLTTLFGNGLTRFRGAMKLLTTGAIPDDIAKCHANDDHLDISRLGTNQHGAGFVDQRTSVFTLPSAQALDPGQHEQAAGVMALKSDTGFVDQRTSIFTLPSAQALDPGQHEQAAGVVTCNLDASYLVALK